MAKLLQDFIRNNGLSALADKYFINIKRHKKYPNLVLLKYNQIESPMGEPVVQLCRGIILDEKDDWKVVNWTYSKFFNFSEGHAAKIDWSTARVYDKVDGSLFQLYWYDGAWQAASSGLPDASGNISGGATYAEFAELFWDTWKTLGYRLPDDTSLCYAFELCTKYNRVVVHHEKPRIVLHGARNLISYQEVAPEGIAASHGWECVKQYPLTSIEEIVEAAKALDPIQNEGYVVCDGNFNRVKMKTPQYVALAHIKDGMSARRLLEIVRSNESEEFLSYFPDWRSDFEVVKSKYSTLISEIESFYSTVKDIPVQKDFALTVVKKPWSGVLFALRAGKVTSVKEALANMSITGLEDLLKLEVKMLYPVAE